MILSQSTSQSFVIKGALVSVLSLLLCGHVAASSKAQKELDSVQRSQGNSIPLGARQNGAMISVSAPRLNRVDRLPTEVLLSASYFQPKGTVDLTGMGSFSRELFGDTAQFGLQLRQRVYNQGAWRVSAQLGAFMARQNAQVTLSNTTEAGAELSSMNFDLMPRLSRSWTPLKELGPFDLGIGLGATYLVYIQSASTPLLNTSQSAWGAIVSPDISWAFSERASINVQYKAVMASAMDWMAHHFSIGLGLEL